MLEQEEKQAPAHCKSRARIIIPPLLLLISVACGAAASLAAWSTAKADRDSISHYFEGSPASLALCILITLSLILSFFLPIIIKGKLTDGSNRVTSVLSWLTGIAAAAVSVYSLVKGLGVSWDILFSLIALASAVFFIIRPLKNREAVKILLSFASTALGIAMIALLYFDFEIELNSHYKLATQFAAVGLMLGTMADARAAMSRIGLRWSVILRSLSLTLTLVCFCAVTTAFICVNTALPTYYLVFAIFFLIYSLLTACELISLSLADT